MSIRDLQAFRDERTRKMMYDPIAFGMMMANFWWNAWTCCLPRVTVTAQIVPFPQKRPLKEPQP